MRKQTKSRKPENIGKGKITPVQIAFIVDRYLSDNNYNHTRSAFRSEASNLISKSPVREAPKSLLSLGDILDEYIKLKEQKVMLDQGWCRLEHEKSRIHNLLRGMQNVMNDYNSGGDNLAPTMPKSVPAGQFPTYNTPAIMPTSDPTSFSTSITSHSNLKRKGPNSLVDALDTSKKSRRCILPKESSIVAQVDNSDKKHEDCASKSYILDNLQSETQVQGSNVINCLFTESNLSPSANSSGPNTPPQESPSQIENSISALENHSTANCSDITQQITSSTTQTIRVSPSKKIAYYSIEKTHCISTSSPVKTDLTRLNRKEHVKGRLDFEACENSSPVGTSTPEFDREGGGGILDLDMIDLENFGMDFNLSELLVEFDLYNNDIC